MYGRKVKLRFFFILLILITFILSAFLVLKSLEENVIYFQSPSEIKDIAEIEKTKKIRVGGMVKTNSISILHYHCQNVHHISCFQPRPESLKSKRKQKTTITVTSIPFLSAAQTLSLQST